MSELSWWSGLRPVAGVLVLVLAGCSHGTQAGGKATVIHGKNGITLPPPPAAAIVPVTDDYHGEKVVDNYRWLEDGNSPQTRGWIDAQMKYTDDYLRQVKNRPEIAASLKKLLDVDSYGTPMERGGRYFFMKRLAGQNQASLYMRTKWNGEDKLLLDVTKLSKDQNTSVTIESIASSGKLIAYGERSGGADEQSIHVLDVATEKDLPDVLPPARYDVAFDHEAKGFYYSRFTHEGTNVYYHRLGTQVDKDAFVFGKTFNGQALGELDLMSVSVTENGHYLVVSVSHGVPATRDGILVKDLRKPDAPFVPVIYGIEAHAQLATMGDRFFLLTNYEAPNSRVVEVTPGEAPDAWKTVVPAGGEVIDQFSIVGGQMFLRRLHDVKTETTSYSLDGKQTGSIDYPGIGAGTGLSGRSTGKEGFYSFQSFTQPPTIYHYETGPHKSAVFAASKAPFDSSQYEIHQVFYHSKDGTRVPMFIAGKKGLKQDGNARLLLTAYGGFDVDMLPTWSTSFAWWMEQGGFVALPNLRGGEEYGEAWHKAAMFEKKQNVFDDFFAAAHYLIDNHYTTSERLAIAGASNGGLLMGAAMTQHPELFGAIWCGYPLLDMLRYQNFLFGRLWTTEYGSSENPQQFDYLSRYSPYQNVKPGTKFPAIMFFSGDSDTRVAPLHARKMTALVQAENGGDRPILLHYTTTGGHSAGVSLQQSIADSSDELAFLWNETNVQ